MGITERLANMTIAEVLIAIAVLLVLRFTLIRVKSPVAKSAAEMAESLAVAMGLVFLLIRPFVVQAFFIPSESMVPTLEIDDRILVNKFVYRFGEPELGDVIVFKSPPEAQHDEADFIKRVIAVSGDEIRIAPGYVMIGDSRYDHQQLANDVLTDYGGDGGTPKVRLLDDKILADGQEVSKAEVASAAGRPNAKVVIHPGKVYINGKPIKEPYIAEDADDSYPDGSRCFVKPEWLGKDKQGRSIVKVPKGKLLVLGDNRNNSGDARYWGLLDRERVLGKAMFVFWPLNRIKVVH